MEHIGRDARGYTIYSVVGHDSWPRLTFQAIVMVVRVDSGSKTWDGLGFKYEITSFYCGKKLPTIMVSNVVVWIRGQTMLLIWRLRMLFVTHHFLFLFCFLMLHNQRWCTPAFYVIDAIVYKYFLMILAMYSTFVSTTRSHSYVLISSYVLMRECIWHTVKPIMSSRQPIQFR